MGCISRGRIAEKSSWSYPFHTLVVTSFGEMALAPSQPAVRSFPSKMKMGFASMLKKVKTKSDPYIIVRMQAPDPKKGRQRPQYVDIARDRA